MITTHTLPDSSTPYQNLLTIRMPAGTVSASCPEKKKVIFISEI